MSKQEIQQRIEKLKKLINHHRYLYHVLDKQEISDQALDSLKKELFDLEQQHPEFITKDSPTQRVEGRPLKEFQKVAHAEKMLSLNDVFSKEDFFDWYERISKLLTSEEKNKIDFYCELKIDGLAIELEYENGVLKTGSTRGDGVTGEDVTQNLKTIQAIPLSVEVSSFKFQAPSLVVRGEVFISKKEFANINALQQRKGLPAYANPRNTAAGSIRQLDPTIAASRNLDSFAYDIVVGVETATHDLKHELLKKLGFKTNPHNRHCKTIKEVFSFYEYVGKIRESLPYEIDGVVVIINNNQLFEKLGVVGKAPRGAVAFKFAQTQAVTKVEDIRLQVGRTGAITPVAVLEPVQVSGVTITRATLHNEDEIKRLGLKIGDTVIVARAGDVIPDIIKVLPELRNGKEKYFVMPRRCPSCGTALEKSETESLLRCPNTKCYARSHRAFYHFVSRTAFNIDGLGPKIIDRLLDEGIIQDPADLFSLKEQDVVSLERFAEKSAKNLLQSIKEKKQVSLPRFIYALGIRNVGEETAVDLASHFGSIKKLQNASKKEIKSLLNIGPVVATSIVQWFTDAGNIKFLDKLLKAGVIVKKQKPEAGGQRLSGKVMVFTGTMETIDRNTAKEKVRKLGGVISESVSKKTYALVAGKDQGSKFKKAQKLGVRILNENQFLKLIG